MPSTSARDGACVCGLPVRRHFNAEGHKISCSKLTFIDSLQVAQQVTFWHWIEGRPRLVGAVIAEFDPTRMFVRLRDCHLHVDAEYGGASTSIYPSTRIIDISRLRS